MHKAGKKISMNTSQLLEKDRAYVWHPYRQMQTEQESIPIVRGRGSYLYTSDGRSLFDGCSSWWVNLHGHSHSYIIEKITEQLHRLEHVVFAECTHHPAVELAERLLALCPGKSKAFYSDNGSTAVEVALKMAIQYWHNLKIPKDKLICFNRAYHGDTFGTMAAAGKHEFHRPFWPFLYEVEKIDPPVSGQEERSLQQLADLIKKEKIAAFIFEPLIQGSSGMRLHSQKGLDALLKLCRENHILTIADEVFTGFGRTGPIFATDLLTEKPDIICFSKGLTGGFLPLGLTLCREEIYEKFLSERLETALLHGHSYTGNPLACAAALASLDLLLDEACTRQRAMIEEQHKAFAAICGDHPKLTRCEVLGTILILEYCHKENSYFSSLCKRLVAHFLKHDILIRPLGNVFFLLPPYSTTIDDLQKIYDTILMTLEGDQW